MSLRSRAVAVVAALAVSLPLTAQVLPAGASSYQQLTVAQQQELQRAVDAELAVRGGEQVAPNKVVWADGGGDTTIPYPGQEKAAGDWQTCAYGNFCVYERGNFNGTKYTFYNCRFYPFETDFFSWVNNQTGHTVATFHWNTGNGETRTAGAWAIEDYWHGYSYSGITPC
ncbi:hypothetical protein [Kribbella sp. NPDC051770]|uniref:hypothetical protein n=1 Tax=Kribbella sp. NPDC051770 TaxID=3155413 RepID=UPI00341385A2